MTVDIVRTGGIVEQMTVEEFTRWICLMEAFHVIKQKGDDLKVDIMEFIKINAIDAYIQERFPSALADIKTELKAGIL